MQCRGDGSIPEQNRIWKQRLFYFCAIVTVTISQRHDLGEEKIILIPSFCLSR